MRPLGSFARPAAPRAPTEMDATPVIVGLLVFGGIEVSMYASFLRRLREEHRPVWEALGRPRPFLSHAGTTLRTRRFEFGGRWRALHDPVLRRLAIADCVVGSVYLGGFAISLVWLMVLRG